MLLHLLFHFYIKKKIENIIMSINITKKIQFTFLNLKKILLINLVALISHLNL